MPGQAVGGPVPTVREIGASGRPGASQDLNPFKSIVVPTERVWQSCQVNMSNHGAITLVAGEAPGRYLFVGIGNERATKPGANSTSRGCSTYCFTWPWLLLCTLILVGWQSAHGAPPVLRLAGSFMQFQDEMKSWEPAVWRQILDRMKELEMDTVIVQMLAEENADGTTDSFIGPSGAEDATETILNYADTSGFKADRK